MADMKADGQNPATPALLRFFAHESAGGMALALAALLALVISNSAWQPTYAALIQTPVEFRLSTWLVLAKPLVVWVNDFPD